MNAPFHKLALDATMEALIRGRAWSRLVTKHGVNVRRDDTRKGYHVLHATKGWRFVSDKRLALA